MEWVAYKREGRDGGVAYREGEEGVVVVQRFVIRSMKTKRYMKAGLCEIGCRYRTYIHARVEGHEREEEKGRGKNASNQSRVEGVAFTSFRVIVVEH